MTTTSILLPFLLLLLPSVIHAANLGFAHQAAKREVTLTSLPVLFFLLGLFVGALLLGLIMHYCVWKPRENRRRNEWSLTGLSNDQKTVVMGEEDEEDAENGASLELAPTSRSPPVPAVIMSLSTMRNQRLFDLASTSTESAVVENNDHTTTTDATHIADSGVVVDTENPSEPSVSLPTTFHNTTNSEEVNDTAAAAATAGATRMLVEQPQAQDENETKETAATRSSVHAQAPNVDDALDDDAAGDMQDVPPACHCTPSPPSVLSSSITSSKSCCDHDDAIYTTTASLAMNATADALEQCENEE